MAEENLAGRGGKDDILCPYRSEKIASAPKLSPTALRSPGPRRHPIEYVQHKTKRLDALRLCAANRGAKGTANHYEQR